MASPAPQRDEFVPDTLPESTVSAQDKAPALSSSKALARFEFESGRGNEGTKILMVEWEDQESSGGSMNMENWEISWEGKTTVISAKDGAEGKLHRLYFLLAPGVSIPPIVKLSQKGGNTMQTNPLPAIFPPELGVSATTQGKKGVLHTVWGKQRLSVLQKEIESEMKNGEGVGLEMALQEKQWIEENFGVSARVASDIPQPISPTSPKSPGGGRLSEKLKGLKLGTGASELTALPAERGSSDIDTQRSNNPLSPDIGDVAVSSFSLFHGATSRPSRAVAQNPPSRLIAIQNQSYPNSRVSSLDAIAGGHVPRKEDPEPEDDLFAIKLSPRSPEMTKSPFSFAPKDVAPWMKDR